MITWTLLFQQKSRMEQHYERIVWALEPEHRRLKGKANFQPSVDYLNLGSGNGKRNRINLKLPLGVSIVQIKKLLFL